MYAYISGIVVSILETSIIIDNQGIGYEVFTPNPHKYKKGKEAVIHTYFYVREDEQSLFGFEDDKTLSFFKNIIKVKGVGPKTAMSILGKASYSSIVNAIETSDIKFLRTLPGIGPKMASQIVLDLQGKLVTEVSEVSNPILEDVNLALKGLNFKQSEINSIQNDLKALETEDLNELIRHALALLRK